MLFASDLPIEQKSTTPDKRNAALTQLYLQHAATLRRIALAKGASGADADELVQELFIRLQRNDKFATLRCTEAYLRTMLVNLMTDGFRQSLRSPDLVDIDDVAPPVASAYNDPETRLSEQKALECMIQDWSALPAECRQVFFLHRIENKSYDVIAKTCGLTIAGVRKHLRDALLILTTKRIERDNQ